jgi:hypothetical protein
MTDYKIPDLPSDEELGITPEDVEAFEAPDAPRKGQQPPAPEQPAGGKGGGKPPKPPKPPKAPAQPAPRGGTRGWLTLVALLLLAWLSSTGRAVPGAVPANAPDTAFSSARAMTELVQIARLPHPPGSPEHQRVRAYLMRRLTDLGLQPQDLTTTVMLRSGSSVRAALVHDIVARIPGTASTGAVLIAAHYDSRPLSPGGADDGAGVVSILEAVRAVKAGPPLKNDVIVLFTDAEEEGLLGARAFVADTTWMRNVRLAVNFDMRGAGGPAIMFQTGPQDGWVVHELARGDSHPFANSISQAVYSHLPNDTDFSIFEKAGLQGLNFAAIGRPDVYHQSDDDPENLSEGTLQDVGLQALSMMRTFGGADLATVDAPDVVYFRVPFVGLVEYAQRWVMPITLGILLLFAGVVVWGRRKGARWSGMATGLVLSVLSFGAAWGIGFVLFPWLRQFHPEYGALAAAAFHSEGWYVLALTGVSFFVVTTLLGFGRLRCSTAELSLGVLLLPVAGVVWLTFQVPAGAMNLQGPVLAALLATAVALGYASNGRPGLLGWILVVILAAPVLVFLVPVVELLWLAGSFRIAAALGVLEEPNRWWAPLGGLAVGAACLGVGILLARPGPTRPAPSTLLYALDHGSGRAFWATRPESDSAAAKSPARTWARERAGAPFDTVRSLEPFMFRNVRYATAPARAIAAPQPEVLLLGDSWANGRHLVRIAIHSAVGAERLLIRLPNDSVARLEAVDGQPLPPPGDAFQPYDEPVLDHWGGTQDSVLVDLDVDSAAQSIDLVVVEQLLRPGELLGADAFRRPPSLEPDPATSSDRALLRTPVHLALMPRTQRPSTAGAQGGTGGEGVWPNGSSPR